MIEIYTGIPGSGKTLCAVEKMLTYLERGGIVATNVELNRTGIRRYLRRKGYLLHPDQLVDIDTIEKARAPHRLLPKGTREKPNLIILDECAILFPSREYTKTPKEFFKFCLMIRRAHTDLIMICQRLNQIDKQFRNLAQFRMHHTNLGRSFKLPIVGKFPVEVIIKAQFDQGNNYMFFTTSFLKKSVYNCYYTLQEVVTFERKDQRKIVRKKYHDTLDHRFRYYRFVAKRMLQKVVGSRIGVYSKKYFERIRDKKVRKDRGKINERKRGNT